METPKLRHIVMLKFKDGVDRASASAAIDAELAKLPAAIPQIISYVFGVDAQLDPERNHDYAVVADFADVAGYEVYAKHPAHIEAIQKAIRPVIAPGGRAAAQFMLPPVAAL